VPNLWDQELSQSSIDRFPERATDLLLSEDVQISNNGRIMANTEYGNKIEDDLMFEI
jgi:hypothetical protein